MNKRRTREAMASQHHPRGRSFRDELAWRACARAGDQVMRLAAALGYHVDQGAGYAR
jgi:hypothetical protein